MLHITNGDETVQRIRESGITGDLLPWRDVLHEGPVPEGLPLKQLSHTRAEFIASVGWGDANAVLREFMERDRTLRDFATHDEVVLWFEHDLYDQLQLIQLLDFFASGELSETQLTLVCRDEFLGPATPERIAQLFPIRAPVTQAQLALGREAWQAFRSPNPRRVEQVARRNSVHLAFLAPALQRQLAQFPSTDNGLSRTEQQILEHVAGGAATPEAAFLAVLETDQPAFLGDAAFALYVDRLNTGREPLLATRESDKLLPARSDPSFWQTAISITDAGRRVLAGDADAVRMNGIDRWVGGVHLRSRDNDWRWNAGAGRMEQHADQRA